MRIPMDILSQMIPRTDSGADTRQKTATTAKSDTVFGKMLDETRTEKNSEKTREVVETVETGETSAKDDVGPEIPQKTEKDTEKNTDKNTDDNLEENDALAAGVMGYQNTIVFILEGDKESATTPEVIADTFLIDGVTGIDDATAPTKAGTDAANAQTEQAAANTEPKEVAPGAEAAQETAITAPEIKAAVEAGSVETSETVMTPVTAETAEVVVTAETVNVKTATNTDKANVAETTEAGSKEGNIEGEVTARRPVIRTSEQRENEENSSGFSNNGDLSPLENENDAVPVKGHKEKTYSDAEDTAKNTAGDAGEPVNNYQIPITENIKPERFQADQQMKRAADMPVKTENLFEEMVSRIETMHTESQQTVTIQLKPEVLGKVALEIAMDAAGLHVKINAANSDVRSMLNGQINALIESLENKGIEVVEVEVAYTGVDNGAFQETRKDQAQPERQRRSFRVDNIEENAAYYAALPYETLEYYLDAGVSSVEYRA